MRVLPLLTLVLWLSPSVACASSKRGPYSLELIDENGERLPTFSHGGRTYVLGREGERYSLRIRNRSPARAEFVTSVDGRDVLEGTPATWGKRGYIVNAWDQVVIDGFRLDHESVAAFRFGTVRGSYAAKMGDAREVGVIGVAVFAGRDNVIEAEPIVRAPRKPEADSAGADPKAFGPGGLGTGLNPALGGAQGGAGNGDALGFNGLGTHGSGATTVDKLSRMEPKRQEVAPSRRGSASATEVDERPGLGTEFGEKRDSRVTVVDFTRASTAPIAQLTIRYDDREGLRAIGIDVDPDRDQREADRRENAQPFHESFCTPPPGWVR